MMTVFLGECGKMRMRLAIEGEKVRRCSEYDCSTKRVGLNVVVCMGSN